MPDRSLLVSAQIFHRLDAEVLYLTVDICHKTLLVNMDSCCTIGVVSIAAAARMPTVS